MTSDIDRLLSERARLRSHGRQQRKNLDAIYRQQAAQMLAAQFSDFIQLPPRQIIAGYYPQGSEMDILPLLKNLEAAGHTIALPLVVAPQMPLEFHTWQVGSATKPGAHGIMVPVASASVQPDYIFVPLTAFTEDGDRLGSGAGYYDRTLAVLRPRLAGAVIGIAFECQKLDHIPTEPHDQPLDLVVTEQFIHYCHP